MTHQPAHQTTITIAAIDLDDTALRSDKQMSPRVLTALRAWQAVGNRLIIATGRPPRAMQSLPPELHEVPWICYNGAEIHSQGAIIYHDLIPALAAQEIVAQVGYNLPAATIGLEIDGELHLNREMVRPMPYRVTDLRTLAHRATAKILVWHDPVEELLPHIAALPHQARLLYSEKYKFVQILAQQADKATALRFLVEQWGATLGNVVAFGDDTNDVEMVRQSGLGVAMANAVAEVKAVARRHVPTNDEDGVACLLEELLAA
jgi:5-amino-6-(5-phospho-D-ribitylamino)uracil phosphatase